MKRIFGAGLVLVAPMALTVYVLYSLMKTVSGLYPMLGQPWSALAGLLTVVFVLFVVGLLTRTALGSVLDDLDELAGHIPGMGMIYRGTKDLVKALAGEESQFKHPVSVELAKGTKIRLLGFVTRQDVGRLGKPGDVAVYLPQSYGIAGFTLVVPRSNVKALDVRSQDLLQFALTGGLSGDVLAHGKRVGKK